MLADHGTLPEATGSRAPTPSTELLQSLRRLARPNSAREPRRVSLAPCSPGLGAPSSARSGDGLSSTFPAGRVPAVGSRALGGGLRQKLPLQFTQHQLLREGSSAAPADDAADPEARRRFQETLSSVEAALAGMQTGDRQRDEREVAPVPSGMGMQAEAMGAMRGDRFNRRSPRRVHEDTDFFDHDASPPPPTHAAAQVRINGKLDAIRKDPAARRDFEMRLRAARERKRPSNGKDFDAINQVKLKNYAVEARDEVRHQHAAKKAEVRSLVVRRREEAEQAAEVRATWWVERPEARRIAREEEARRQEEDSEKARRCGLLLQHMLVVSFAVRLCKESQEEKIRQAEKRRQVRACQLIQGWILRQIARIRRRVVYSNAAKFKVAVTAYARMMRPALMAAAQPRVSWFLNRVEDQAEVSMTSIVRNYIRQVRRVQHAFRKMVRQRKARTDALLDHFRAVRILSSVPQILVPQQSPQAPPPTPGGAAGAPPPTPSGRLGRKASLERNGSKERQRMDTRQPSLERSTTRNLEQQPAGRRVSSNHRQPHPTTGKSGHRLSCHFASESSAFWGGGDSAPPTRAAGIYGTIDSGRSFVRDFRGLELLPHFLRVHVIRQHVVEMHQSFYERKRKWKQKRASMQVEDEIEHMGLGWKSADLDVVREHPKPIELTRMGALYADTYEGYLRGDFKYLIHSRKQLLGKAWRTWWRAANNMEVEEDHLGLLGQVTSIGELGAAAASQAGQTAVWRKGKKSARVQVASAGAQSEAQLDIMRSLSCRSRSFTRRRSTLSSIGSVSSSLALEP